MEDSSEPSTTSRPFSLPPVASRFPSLRRNEGREAYRHRSLPPQTASPSASGESQEATFAVLYDDGPDYHVGYCDESGSLRSGHNRDLSESSLSPTFNTSGSRSNSGQQPRQPNFVTNQRLLAEGFLNSKESLEMVPKYPVSQETLNMQNLTNSYSAEKSRQFNPAMWNDEHGRRIGHGPNESWCSCDEDHDSPKQEEDITKVDLEAQRQAVAPSPPSTDKKPGGPPKDEFTVS